MENVHYSMREEIPLNTLNIYVARTWMFPSCIVAEPFPYSSLLKVAFLALNRIRSAPSRILLILLFKLLLKHLD